MFPNLSIKKWGFILKDIFLSLFCSCSCFYRWCCCCRFAIVDVSLRLVPLLASFFLFGFSFLLSILPQFYRASFSSSFPSYSLQNGECIWVLCGGVLFFKCCVYTYFFFASSIWFLLWFAVCRCCSMLHSVWHFDFYLNKHIAFHFDFRFSIPRKNKIKINRRWGNGTHTTNSIEKINFDSPVYVQIFVFVSIYIDIDTSFVCFLRRRRCRRYCRTIMRARRITWNFILLLLFYVLHADVFTKYSPSISFYPHLGKSYSIPPLPIPLLNTLFLSLFLFPLFFCLFTSTQASISGCRFFSVCIISFRW